MGKPCTVASFGGVWIGRTMPPGARGVGGQCTGHNRLISVNIRNACNTKINISRPEWSCCSPIPGVGGEIFWDGLEFWRDFPWSWAYFYTFSRFYNRNGISWGGLNPDNHPYMRQWVGELEAIAPVGDKIHFRICVADLVFQNKLIWGYCCWALGPEWSDFWDADYSDNRLRCSCSSCSLSLSCLLQTMLTVFDDVFRIFQSNARQTNGRNRV